MATFQFYWWRKISGAPHALFQARTDTWVEPPMFCKLAEKVPRMTKKIQSPWRDSNPQRWGASGSMPTTLTIWVDHPLRGFWSSCHFYWGDFDHPVISVEGILITLSFLSQGGFDRGDFDIYSDAAMDSTNGYLKNYENFTIMTQYMHI